MLQLSHPSNFTNNTSLNILIHICIIFLPCKVLLHIFKIVTTNKNECLYDPSSSTDGTCEGRFMRKIRPVMASIGRSRKNYTASESWCDDSSGGLYVRLRRREQGTTLSISHRYIGKY
jgi:hypothetical protein